jgi:hypothetical protein
MHSGQQRVTVRSQGGQLGGALRASHFVLLAATSEVSLQPEGQVLRAESTGDLIRSSCDIPCFFLLRIQPSRQSATWAQIRAPISSHTRMMQVHSELNRKTVQ